MSPKICIYYEIITIGKLGNIVIFSYQCDFIFFF